MAVTLTIDLITPATDAASSDGAIAFTVAGLPSGTGEAQLRDAQANLVTSQQIANGPASFPGLLAARYTLAVADSGGTLNSTATSVQVGVRVYGCTDPGADNYDPAATDENGSCVFSDHLALVEELPALAPVGVPLWLTLAALPVPGAFAAGAACLLDLSGLGTTAGVQVRVDGYLFTSGPLIVPGRFQDAASLLEALAGLPALTAAYQLSQPTAGQVLIAARTPGLPGAPTVTSSNSGAVSLTSSAGEAGLWSEKRYRWGCYLEVWAGCGSVFGGDTTKDTAQLAQRLSLPYRPDNAYPFDVAAALRGFTGHVYPLGGAGCPDRLVSYFVRFGEEFATTPTGQPRPRTTYESPVAWGLEAMELPPRRADRYLLTTRPFPWLVAAGAPVPVCWLQTPSETTRTTLRYRLATSREVVALALPHETATGQVTQAGDLLPEVPGLLSGRLCDNEVPLAELVFGASGQPVSFANRQGGADTVWFTGTAEPSGKRTAATYTTGSGPRNQAADYQPSTRYTSGLLDRATWDWLRQELAVSPAVWLETVAGPLPMLLADLTTDADVGKGEYSVSIDLQPAPVRGLSN